MHFSYHEHDWAFPNVDTSEFSFLWIAYPYSLYMFLLGCWYFSYWYLRAFYILVKWALGLWDLLQTVFPGMSLFFWLVGGYLLLLFFFHLAKVFYVFISVVSVFYGWTLCSYCNSHQSNERQKTGVAGYVHRVWSQTPRIPLQALSHMEI